METRDRPDDSIEVTPAMTEAGGKVLCETFQLCGEYSAMAISAEVYRAMERRRLAGRPDKSAPETPDPENA